MDAKPELPIWTEEALSRLLGARDGYVHVLVAVRRLIGSIDGPYSPRIHPRHVRKRAARDAALKPLREIEARIKSDLDSCKEAYDRERDRANKHTLTTPQQQ